MYESLLTEIERAVQTVYQLDDPTPLEPLRLPGPDTVKGGAASSIANVFLKREDRSRIHSYKWRGAFNKMSWLVESGFRGPVIATSAGNHGQGVAAAASRLGLFATVFMPTSTPLLKQKSVLEHGGPNVEIVLAGDNFDESQTHAAAFAESNGATVIHPFDDLQVIAGQATVGVEILEQMSLVDRIYLPIGGGGLASGVAAWCKHKSPATKIIGVEVEGQDSMRQSLAAQQRITLKEVDRFCDGTAVALPGAITFELCKSLLDEIVTVTNDEVCAAIQVAWEEKRLITEPSGAIALAAVLANRPAHDESVVAVVSGSNTDFLTIPVIARRSQMSKPSLRYFQFEISENKGSLINLLDQLMDGVNIVDFQYGKTSLDTAAPVLGFNATPEELDQFVARLNSTTISATEVSGDQTVAYRVIPFQPGLTRDPCFLRVDFPDRPGALRELMRRSSGLTSICYFNFIESGESEGHALIGFEFEMPSMRDQFFEVLNELNFAHSFVNASRLLGGHLHFENA